MVFLTRRSAQTIAVLAVTQLTGWGTSFEVLGVMGRIIAPELRLPNEVIFGGLTVMMIVSALAGPKVGRLLERHGAARVLALGATAFAVGLAFLAVSTNGAVYMLAWIVIGLGGAFGLSAPAYTAVVEREGPDARRIIAILMLFTGLLVTILWPLLALVNDLVGWRLTFAACAALQLFVCVPLYLFALPKPVAATAEGQQQAQLPPVALTDGERRRAFLLVACAITISSFVTFGLAPALLALLQQAGATPELALQLAAARGVFGISARFVDMVFGQRGSPLVTASAGSLLIITGLTLLLLMPGSTAGLWLFMILYGFGSGVFAVARAVLPLALFSPREFGLHSARLSLPQNLANAAAPVIFTAFLDRLGYQSAVVFASGLACVTLLAIVLLVRLVRRAQVRVPLTPSPP
ncbi:MFS family permease [Pseudorhizobium tarimense]|uniref:MFS family permease n=1 Tax=Pseudorhizobium tarimense TaxID=1079109 RepID=A0ABV2H084_9HYPH|nr:MFS transporter [Pseudorhizobium tarimense]MCJ8517304.1 MFS transporter [Pseudorhizobium tarimense]